MKTKALILAGGLGTRLRPITDTVPKCLVEVGGRPLLDYWFEALHTAGIHDVLINTHHLPGQIRSFIAGKNEGGFRAVETFEPRLLGSAGTVSANRAWADDADHVVIIYGDNLSDVDIGEIVAAHRRNDVAITMLLFRAPNPSACGIAELDASGRLIGFVEKPAQPKSNLANAGVYVVTATAWREIADMKAFDLAFHVLPAFLGRMKGYIFDGYHVDIGNMEALLSAEKSMTGRGRSTEQRR